MSILTTAPIPPAIAGCVDGGATSDIPDGRLEVTTVTTGVDLDPNGYTLTVAGLDGQPSGDQVQSIGRNEITRMSGLLLGEYSVGLSDVAANCTVAGDNPRTVTIVADELVRTTFNVNCAKL